MRSLRVAASIIVLAGCSVDAVRPQAPAEGFIQNGDIKLSYRVDRPDGPGPFPAVVIGHGSGQVTKDQQSSFANQMVARGYIALRYDKRGVGQSTGVYSGVGVFNSERTFADLSGDMAAGVEFLRTQPDVDGKRVGLMGASQAGWIIPLAAKKTGAAFMLIFSGPTVSVGAENYYSDFAENGRESLEKAYDELSRFRGPHGFDPVPTLETLDVPGLWLLGEADDSIPERNTAAILRALAAKGRPFSLVEYPGANHSLFNPVTGQHAPTWADIDRWFARK